MAPVYDMLPMRWRPNPVLGGAPDYTPFDVDEFAATGGAARPALDFWLRLTGSKKVSAGMVDLAAEMAKRVVAAAPEQIGLRSTTRRQ